ncbi:MAG TPA: 4-hydroxy-tetrahydrodipicolinate synthase [Spirochaetia bacterium]|nr:4-hydroxy-tetrahydrodipicolinate synthase [Spirochaetia bacterium]
MAMDFGRLITAMVTPFSKDNAIDYTMARKLAKHLVQSGSDGLVVSGTTGESPVLSKEEKIELFRAVVDEVGGQAAVIAGTGSYNTQESIVTTQAAEKVGVDGVLLVAPYYNKPSQEGLYQHFRSVAESTHLPVMLYNIPGRCSVNIAPATVERLAALDNVVALKEAAGSMDQLSEIMRAVPDNFAVYSGDDSLTLPMMALGAKGIVSVAAHLVAGKIKDMINAFMTGNTTLATKLHLELYPLFRGIFITSNPVPVKAALVMTGWKVGGVRLPLVEVTKEEKNALKGLLEKQGLI